VIHNNYKKEKKERKKENKNGGYATKILKENTKVFRGNQIMVTW